MTMRYWIQNLLPQIVNRRISRRRRRSQMAAEVLEIRALLSTFTVSNIADSGLGSLREAIDLANSTLGADTIDFDNSFDVAQTITLTGSQLEFFGADTTTITGPAAGVTVSGGGLSRVFLVNLGSSASISGLTITGGSSDNGGGVSNFGDLTLTNCTISGNSASDSGGGLYNSGAAATLSMTNSTVSGNFSASGGAGLCSLRSTTALINCTISGNTSSSTIGVRAGLGFQGADGFDGTNPPISTPDTNAAVNDGWIVETVNNEIVVFDKSSGTPLLSESLDDFFAPSGNISARHPRVVWDPLASRWYVIAIDWNSDSNVLLAISDDANPLHGFSTQFAVPATPTLSGSPLPTVGYNADSITISVNDANGGVYVTVLDKAQALADILTAVQLLPNFDFHTFVPAQQATAVPGDPIWFIVSPQHLDQGDTSTTIQLAKVEDPFNLPFFSQYSITVDAYGGYSQFFDQPGGAGTVGTIEGSTNDNNQLFEYNDTLVAAFPASTPADGYYYPKVHYYKIDVSTGTPSLMMEGVVDPGLGVATFCPSAAMNPNTGDLGLTWMQSSSGESVSMYVGTVSLAGSVSTYVAATGVPWLTHSFTSSSYSTVVYDPSSDSFWAANEYAGNENVLFHSNTWIQQFGPLTSDSRGGGLESVDGNASLINCTVSGNSATRGGGIYATDGVLTLAGCIVSGNTAGYSGGGTYAAAGDSTLTDCTVTDNSSGYYNGGIVNRYGTTALTSCIVSGNSAPRNGGGVTNVYGTTYLTDCTVNDNSARNGGGIYNLDGLIALTNSTVSGNSASSSGGGLYNSRGTLTLAESTVSNNAAFHYGGGLWNGFNGGSTLTDSTVGGNFGVAGGGIYSDGTLALSSCTVSGNSAGSGGGVYVKYGTAALTNCTISGNASSGGGGLSFWSPSSVTLTNCTVSGNSAYDQGGGIRTLSDLTLTNCTVSGNTAGDTGGGIENLASNVTLTNCTVSANSAANGGGGIENFSTVSSFGTVTLINTIVAGNTNDLAAASDIFNFGSGSVAGSYNLIGTGGSGGLVNGLNGNIVGVANALLAPLDNCGGPTQTMPLLPGSLAINNGTGGAGIPSTDQRGDGRVGAVDIGAFESQGFTFTPVVGSTPQTAVVGNAFANALTVILTANNPNEPVDGGIVNFVVTPAANGASATFSGSAVISGGQASVVATANLIVGSYTVSASMPGAAPVSFALNNITTVITSATSVGWGSQTRVVAGRTNLPWANISKFALTFNSPVAPTTADLSVTGRGGRVYVVNNVSVVGNTVTWTLTTPISAADIVTVTVNPLLAIYSIQLRILPGDVNDDGVVNSQDQILVRNAFLGIGPVSPIPRVFFDLDGDGVVTVADYNLARRYNGTRL